jgi:hypothetical protein
MPADAITGALMVMRRAHALLDMAEVAAKGRSTAPGDEYEELREMVAHTRDVLETAALNAHCALDEARLLEKTP